MKNIINEIKKWQAEKMGNDCTICYGNNVQTECAACGWWGRVAPVKAANKNETKTYSEGTHYLAEGK